VRIEVADTGKGLTPEECSRLFTPYYTTKLLGTGLGLAIVQSVVSDHHGTISVTSDEGRGTAFRIDLPQRPSGPEYETTRNGGGIQERPIDSGRGIRLKLNKGPKLAAQSSSPPRRRRSQHASIAFPRFPAGRT